jgi:hypothetical protein
MIYYIPQSAAPNYSKDVELADVALRKAGDDLLEALKSNYPLNAKVMVHHTRGSFVGTVCGWKKRDAKVLVLNSKSQKESSWWFVRVELIPICD